MNAPTLVPKHQPRPHTIEARVAKGLALALKQSEALEEDVRTNTLKAAA